MLKIMDNTVKVDTKTLNATIKDGLIVKLFSKLSNKKYISLNDTSQHSGLSIVYPNNRTVNISNGSQSEIKYFQINDYCVEMRFHSWHGDGVILLTEDIETGDLVVEPSAFSGQAGVRSVKWIVPGIDASLKLIAPLYQGIKMNLDDELLQGERFTWPMKWEAGFAILQGSSSGFWLYCKDTSYKYKTLSIGTESDPFGLGFETDAYGAIDSNTSAGGLEWRLNVYDGSWHVPAAYYKTWLYKAYSLEAQEKLRKDWMYDIKMAVSWFPSEIVALDALAKHTDPTKVLLHIPYWRNFGYDENYPEYLPSKDATEFFKHGQKLGFHMMPHGNSIEIDPTHSLYPLFRDYGYINLETKGRHGWGWGKDGFLGVPSSNLNLTKNRDNKVMIKIHPANKMWQSVLMEELKKAVDILKTDALFIDVTCWTANLHNCLLNSTTTTEGMASLIKHVGSMGSGLAMGGEGLNEITFQGLSFAQAHLYKSYHESVPGLERTGGIDLNNFLFGDLCRTIGYSNLSGKTENERLRMKIHEDHGAIPTVTCDVNDLLNPSKAMIEVFDGAR
ncbi:MAG: DUF6259 domain-containing protein [Defluviitaleaceae bacterium]|nr:DUF6259 domain-containing protein [Defluviitaleaceae bacterium]